MMRLSFPSPTTVFLAVRGLVGVLSTLFTTAKNTKVSFSSRTQRTAWKARGSSQGFTPALTDSPPGGPAPNSGAGPGSSGLFCEVLLRTFTVEATGKPDPGNQSQISGSSCPNCEVRACPQFPSSDRRSEEPGSAS